MSTFISKIRARVLYIYIYIYTTRITYLVKWPAAADIRRNILRIRNVPLRFPDTEFRVKQTYVSINTFERYFERITLRSYRLDFIRTG